MHWLNYIRKEKRYLPLSTTGAFVVGAGVVVGFGVVVGRNVVVVGAGVLRAVNVKRSINLPIGTLPI